MACEQDLDVKELTVRHARFARGTDESARPHTNTLTIESGMELRDALEC